MGRQLALRRRPTPRGSLGLAESILDASGQVRNTLFGVLLLTAPAIARMECYWAGSGRLAANAIEAAAVRLSTPSFVKICSMCFFTVDVCISRIMPIS